MTVCLLAHAFESHLDCSFDVLVVHHCNVTCVGDLVPHLTAISQGHALALKNMQAVRVAVNRSYGDLDTPVAAGDEVAFFPPVTGG